MKPLLFLDAIAPKILPRNIFAGRRIVAIQRWMTTLGLICAGSLSLGSPVYGQPINRGLVLFEQGEWAKSIPVLKQQLPPKSSDTLTPTQETVLGYIAQAHWNLGQSAEALQHLDILGQQYQRRGNTAQWGRVRTQQAQYFTDMGNLNQARRLLCQERIQDRIQDQIQDQVAKLQDCDPTSAIGLALSSQDPAGYVAALGSFGVLLNQNSELELAQQILQAALVESDQALQGQYRPQLLTTLGQTHLKLAVRDQTYARLSQEANDQSRVQLFQQRSQSQLKQAIARLEASQQELSALPPSQQHLDTATQLIQAYQYQLGHSDDPRIQQLFQQTQEWLTQQPLSQRKLYTASRLAKLRTHPTFLTSDPTQHFSASCPILNRPPSTFAGDIEPIIQMARALNNTEIEAYTFGLLGRVAQCQNQLPQAQQYVEQAILLAQKSDFRYQWEWQLGQLLQAQGRSQDAIQAYEQAILSLEKVQGDLAVSDRDVQLDLQANTEELFRELAYLQLQQLSNTPTSNQLTQAALANLDRLRQVELQNYLATDCEFPEIQSQWSALEANTAVIRTVLFADRMAIALTYLDQTNQPRSHLHWVNRSESEVNGVINQFRFDLEKRSDLTSKYRQGATTLYDWIVRPFESQLSQAKIDTLVFINDGLLRSIPMATLHDGQSFLVESYAIGNTTYWASSQSNLATLGNEMVAFGLTEPAEVSQYSQPLSFAPLPGVRQELTSIQAILKDSQIQFNQAFSPRVLETTLTQTSPQILHLATHARFGVDPRETFLITGEKQTSRENSPNITVNMLDLYQLIRSLQSPIKLLTLTGCETAVGNDRDALGITGIALQAGVGTVMASLWQIDDQATGEIVPTFYQALNQGLPKAKALQHAQKTWLKTQKGGRQTHPGYWAPLILVGNWR